MKKLILLIGLLGLLISSYGQLQVPAVASSVQASSVVYTDDFTSYSNGDLAGQGSWVSGRGGISVAETSDRIYPNTPGDTKAMRYYNQPLANDQYSEVLIDGIGATAAIGPSIRSSGSGTTENYYGFRGLSGSSKIIKVVSGTESDLTTGLSAISASDILKITISGTTINVYINGIYEGTATDSDLSSGYAGVCTTGNTALVSVSEWEGGEL